jgi:GT2 family glycosyltransferase
MSEQASIAEVTITTVLYNSAGSLARYAAQLGRARTDPRIRFIIVDNASPDDSAQLAAQLLPGAQLIRNTENLGFGGGSNRAWPDVRSRYWLLLNPDVAADAQGIERLVAWMDRHPSVGVASPLLCDDEGRAIPIERAHDSLWRPVVETLRLHKLLPRGLRARWLLPGHGSTADTIRGWVPGAALIARTSAVSATGPFDERLFMYGEDRELCWRMLGAGWQIGVCRAVCFVHPAGASARRTWGDDERTRREVSGHLRASELMRGSVWTHALAAIVGASLTAAAADPRTEPQTRDELRLRGRCYLGWLRPGSAT